MNTTMGGAIPALCMDIPFCYRYQYNSQEDLTWSTSMPADVEQTILLAQAAAAGTAISGVAALEEQAAKEAEEAAALAEAQALLASGDTVSET